MRATNIKSFTAVVVVISSFLLMTSCYKEGVYQPKKKISKIYEEFPEDSGDKRLIQTWEWDGDLLKSISFWQTEMRFYYKGK